MPKPKTSIKMMSDIRTRILHPLFRRRSSSTSTTASSVRSTSADAHSQQLQQQKKQRTRSNVSLGRPASSKRGNSGSAGDTLYEEVETQTQTLLPRRVGEKEEADENVVLEEEEEEVPELAAPTLSTADTQSVERPMATPDFNPVTAAAPVQSLVKEAAKAPLVTVQEPTPDLLTQALPSPPTPPTLPSSKKVEETSISPTTKATSYPPSSQTTTQHQQQQPQPQERTAMTRSAQAQAEGYFAAAPAAAATHKMHRKIWVKRPGASATLVQITEEDLVDDVREMILRKYANSLGRSFDSPDVTLRIVPRQHSHRHGSNEERTLGPEEPMARTLDIYYPGGQSVDEALIIDVPKRHTPRHSPRVLVPYYGGGAAAVAATQEDTRPVESDQGYFPPMPGGAAPPSPHLGSSISVAGSTGSAHHHSISVLGTGQVPPLPSPGSRAIGRHGGRRPRMERNNTSSPTALSTGGTSHTDLRGIGSNTPVPPTLPTPPLSGVNPPVQRSATPPPRVSSPRPGGKSTKRASKRSNQVGGNSNLPSSLLDGTVPPINVLIVEDNIINLKLLEAFMKRLKVRWHTAMNGRDAVTKWRDGGFHLVLMDIQLPIMNGLDATKEIRRLESVNGVGAWAGAKGAAKGGSATSNLAAASETGKKDTTNMSSGAQQAHAQDRDQGEAGAQPAESDKLKNTELFKSPVIIVALTASSLQSDRHEALAAGCNDFLTKPVNFVWLERKVTEWGCMQALIDFDGWRKWKDFSSKPANNQFTSSSSTPMNSKPALVSTSTVTTPASPPTANSTTETTPAEGGLASSSSPDGNGSIKSAASNDPSVPAGSMSSISSGLTNAAGNPVTSSSPPLPPSSPRSRSFSAANKTPTATSPTNNKFSPTSHHSTTTNNNYNNNNSASNNNSSSTSPTSPSSLRNNPTTMIHRPSTLSTITNSSPPNTIQGYAAPPPSSSSSFQGGGAGGATPPGGASSTPFPSSKPPSPSQRSSVTSSDGSDSASGGFGSSGVSGLSNSERDRARREQRKGRGIGGFSGIIGTGAGKGQEGGTGGLSGVVEEGEVV